MFCKDYDNNPVPHNTRFVESRLTCEECICLNSDDKSCVPFNCDLKKCELYRLNSCCPQSCYRGAQVKGKLEASSLLLLFVVLVFFLVTILHMKRRGFCSNLFSYTTHTSNENIYDYGNRSASNSFSNFTRPNHMFTNRAYNNEQRNLGNTHIPDDLNEDLPNSVYSQPLPPRYECIAKHHQLPPYEQPPPYSTVEQNSLQHGVDNVSDNTCDNRSALNPSDTVVEFVDDNAVNRGDATDVGTNNNNNVSNNYDNVVNNNNVSNTNNNVANNNNNVTNNNNNVAITNNNVASNNNNAPNNNNDDSSNNNNLAASVSNQMSSVAL